MISILLAFAFPRILNRTEIGDFTKLFNDNPGVNQMNIRKFDSKFKQVFQKYNNKTNTIPYTIKMQGKDSGPVSLKCVNCIIKRTISDFSFEVQFLNKVKSMEVQMPPNPQNCTISEFICQVYPKNNKDFRIKPNESHHLTMDKSIERIIFSVKGKNEMCSALPKFIQE